MHKNGILQNEVEFYKWGHVKSKPIKNKIRTTTVKTEENIKTEKYYNSEEDIQNNIKRGLKKLDMSYNPDSLKYTNDKFKDIMLEE